MLFRDITGQEEIKRRLIQTVKDNRVSHAQLFHGPEGSRKLAMAIAYARYINCPNRSFGSPDGNTGDSCGVCPSCIKYSKLIHPDLHFIFPVVRTSEVDKEHPMSRDFLNTWRKTLLSENFRLGLNDWYKAANFEKKQGIINADDCSEILKTLSYKSYESEFKVMIIWMADRLYHSAAPKILKILEEPPDKSLFILITENPEKIINTILSRTQAIKFPRLTDGDMLSELTQKYGYHPEEAARIIPVADGNLTRAVKILKNDEEETFYHKTFVEWMRICYSNKLDKTMVFVADLAKVGREKQKNFLMYAERVIRGAFLSNYNNPDLGRLNDEEKEFLIRFGKFINHANIVKFSEELEKAQVHIDRNANPSILFMDLSMTVTILLLTGKKAAESSQ